MYSECEVFENWDYEGGQPYHFKLQMSGYMMTPDIRERLLRILEIVKNKRSWLDGIEYVHNINSKGLYIGGLVTSAGCTSVDPALKSTIDPQTQNIYVGGVVTAYQFINI